jgi:hypothetical protein
MFKVEKSFRKTVQLIVVAGALLSLSGCASLIGDNTRTVCVHSQPQGAGVFVEGHRQGTTPATITLPSYVYGGKVVTLKKEGYHEQTMLVNTKFQPCGLWNILFWPGFLIDGATGSTVKIDPTNLNLSTELQAIEPTASK